jgi:OOP family OmpA-OmpF porin
VKKSLIGLMTTTLFALVIFANTASADPRSDFYVGAGLGASMLNGCEDTTCFGGSSSRDYITAHDLGFKFFTGYRFEDYLAVEGAYYDLGTGVDDDDAPDIFNVFGGSLSALVMMPIDEQTRVFLRGGLFLGQVQERDHSSDGGGSFNNSDLSGVFGIGAEFQAFSNFAVRTEVEYIPNLGSGNHTSGKSGNIEALFASVSVLWNPINSVRPENTFLPTGSGLSSQTGFYVGGGVASVSFHGGEELESDGVFDDIITDIDVGGKIFTGYRFMKYAAAEFAYNYYGDAKSDNDVNESFEAQGLSLSVLGMLPLSDRTTAFAKIGGVYGWLDETAINEAEGQQHFGEDGLSALVGGGLMFDITKNISLRGEVEWIPDFADGTAGFDEDDDEPEEGATGDVDIIASSVNIIWWFR